VRDADDVVERAVRRPVMHELGDDARDIDHAQRIAVGVRARHMAVADQPARTRAVFDDDSLFVENPEFLAQRAREKVTRGSRRGCNDNADRLDGIIGRRLLRDARTRERGQRTQRGP
jgi:hypothetical protein